MNETINWMIEQIKARKNKKFGEAPVILVSYKHKISTIEHTELPDTCGALLITIQAHPSQEKRLRNVFTIIREHLYGFDGWFKYKDQVIEPSIAFTTGQCFNDNVIMLHIQESEILKSFCNKIKDVAEKQKFEYADIEETNGVITRQLQGLMDMMTSNIQEPVQVKSAKLLTADKEILVSNVPTDSELQEKMDRITEECYKALDLKQYESNVGPATKSSKSFRERYTEYWKGCCDVLREESIKEYHGIVMSSDPPEAEPMPLNPVAEVSILTQFSDDIRIEPFDNTDLLALGMEARDESAEEIFEENAQGDEA